jgi:phytoene/squalene synthetase
VLYLAEAFSDRRAALADHVCTALQLTNFWQDVARDFDLGRVYLPEEDRRRFGYTEEDLAARRCTPAFAELMRFEVDRTRDLFYRGFPLVGQIPESIRPDVELFIHGGLAVLRKIEQIGYNVWDRRPVLAKWEKGVLLASALWRRFRTRIAG